MAVGWLGVPGWGVGWGEARSEGAGGPWWRRRRGDEEKSHGKNNFDKKRSGGMTNAEALTGIKESASGSVPGDSPGER